MRILFQGDSITDAGRKREDFYNMGSGGYALFVKAELGFENPVKYEFLNRGVSGNRIVDLYARIKNDIINLKPDVMSILIGVNDVWHELDCENGVDAEKYYKIYSMLIEEIKEALPNVKIIIMEPFCLKASATEEKWEIFRSEVEKRAQMAKKISEKYKLPFIELQKDFDALAEKAPADYWLRDGVHPTDTGNEFIKRKWISAFKELITE